MPKQMVTQLNHARLEAAAFNLKKSEVRITVTAFLTPQVMAMHETLRRMTVTEQPLTVTIETIQMEMAGLGFDEETGEITG